MDYPPFVETCGIGDPRGILGINCRHSYFPTREEYPPQYSKSELAEMHRKNTETKPWTNQRGETRELTQYDASQKMRDMENRMRQTRSLAVGLKEGGDEQGYIEQKARYRAQTAQYKQFCEAMSLKPDLARVYQDGIGRL